MSSANRSKGRINWVEAAIVGVVLAVLAALVVPQFSQAGEDPRQQALRAAVQVVQGQIEMYRVQHEDRYPTLTQFARQMTQATDPQGAAAAAGADGYGPYLRSIPMNPYTGTRDIGNGPIGTSAWYYDQLTGAFRANHAGAF